MNFTGQYQKQFEHFNTLLHVVEHRLDIRNKIIPIYEYKEPFEFYGRGSNGESNLLLSSVDIFNSCNSVECEDSKFESVEDLMSEINSNLEEDVLSVIKDVLKNKYDCIFIRKFD